MRQIRYEMAAAVYASESVSHGATLCRQPQRPRGCAPRDEAATPAATMPVPPPSVRAVRLLETPATDGQVRLLLPAIQIAAVPLPTRFHGHQRSCGVHVSWKTCQGPPRRGPQCAPRTHSDPEALAVTSWLRWDGPAPLACRASVRSPCTPGTCGSLPPRPVA